MRVRRALPLALAALLLTSGCAAGTASEAEVPEVSSSSPAPSAEPAAESRLPTVTDCSAWDALIAGHVAGAQADPTGSDVGPSGFTCRWTTSADPLGPSVQLAGSRANPAPLTAETLAATEGATVLDSAAARSIDGLGYQLIFEDGEVTALDAADLQLSIDVRGLRPDGLVGEPALTLLAGLLTAPAAG